MNPTAPKENRYSGLRSVFHSGVSMPAKLVYFELDDRSGYKGNCWPKQQTIATCLGLSRRAVIEGVQELINRGFLRIERKGKFLTYFLRWADVHVVHRSEPRSVNVVHVIGAPGAHEEPPPPYCVEPYQEPRQEPRCSLCGGSGFAGGTTGADLAICECAAGDAIRRSA